MDGGRREAATEREGGSNRPLYRAMCDRSATALAQDFVQPFIARAPYKLANDSVEDLRHGEHPLLRPGPSTGQEWDGSKADLDDGLPF